MDDEIELLKAMFTEEELTIIPPSSNTTSANNTSLTGVSSNTKNKVSSSLSSSSLSSSTYIQLKLHDTGTSITLIIELPIDYPNNPPHVKFERARIADEVQLMKDIQILINTRHEEQVPCIYDIIELVRTALQIPLSCFICFEPVENNDLYSTNTNKNSIPTVMVLPECEHILHTLCLGPWFWQLIETGRKSTTYTGNLQREKQEKSNLKNIVERAETNVRNIKTRCQTLEKEIELINKQIISAKTLANYSATIQQQTNQQNRKRENNKNSKKNEFLIVAEDNSSYTNYEDTPVLSVTDLTKILNELTIDLKTNQRNLSIANTKFESAIQTAIDNHIELSTTTLALRNSSNDNITPISSPTPSKPNTNNNNDTDISHHLQLCKEGMINSTNGNSINSLLKCPVCRTTVQYTSTINQWYEPWLHQNHHELHNKDIIYEQNKTNNIDVVSPPSVVDLQAILTSDTTTITANTSNSTLSSSPLPYIRVPSEITDPVVKKSLENYAQQWYKGYQHALEIGGIIGSNGSNNTTNTTGEGLASTATIAVKSTVPSENNYSQKNTPNNERSQKSNSKFKPIINKKEH